MEHLFFLEDLFMISGRMVKLLLLIPHRAPCSATAGMPTAAVAHCAPLVPWAMLSNGMYA
jgi:hypothetical protein